MALVAMHPTSEGQYKLTRWMVSFRVGCYGRESELSGNFGGLGGSHQNVMTRLPRVVTQAEGCLHARNSKVFFFKYFSYDANIRKIKVKVEV